MNAGPLNVPVVPNVSSPPEPIVPAAMEVFKAVVLFRLRIPELIVVAPVYVFVPPKISVPVPPDSVIASTPLPLLAKAVEIAIAVPELGVKVSVVVPLVAVGLIDVPVLNPSDPVPVVSQVWLAPSLMVV